MNSRLIIAFLTVTAVALTAGGCGMMQQPTARISSANLGEVSPTYMVMRFDVVVENPYNFALPLSNLDYKLSSEGQEFMNGTADVEGDVPAQSSRVLDIPVRINYRELLSTVSGARPGGSIPYKADLGLSVNVPALGPMRLPMSSEGRLNLPTANGLLQQLPGLVR